MRKFVVVDCGGCGGELKGSAVITATDPMVAAQQATGYAGPMQARPHGPACWIVDNNPASGPPQPNIVCVVVVDQF